MDYRIIDPKKKLISIHFDSILNFMDAEPHPKNQKMYDSCMKKSPWFASGSSWYGPTCSNPKEVIQKSVIGDHELYKKLVPKISKLKEKVGFYNKDYKQKVERTRRVRTKGPQGDEIDIHKVYQGQLDTAWTSTKRISFAKEVKLVTIFIQNEDNANVSAVDSLWRAAVAVFLTEELIAAGKSVRIIVGGASRYATDSNHSMTVSFVVKNFNASLSLERLSAMAHCGFARCVGFGAQSLQPYKLRQSLGSSVDISEEIFPLQLKPEVEAGYSKIIVLGRANNLYSAEQSLNSAYEQIEQFKKGAQYGT